MRLRHAPVLLLAAWLGLGPACSGAKSSPEWSVRLLVAAAHAGDKAGVWKRLSTRTQRRIQDRLAATRTQGGLTVRRPEDLLAAGWAPPAWEPDGTRTLRRTRDEADVEVYSAAGDRQTVHMVREGGEWKLELP